MWCLFETENESMRQLLRLGLWSGGQSVYDQSTNWRQKMQDDAEIGLAVVHLNRISDRLVCNDV